jgi:rubrerythrin
MTKSEMPAGLSVWESELLQHLTHHLDQEADLLATYERLSREAHSEYVAYLFALIGEDEARHHRLFEELVNALRAPVDREVGAMVPTVATAANARELLEVVERFVKAERADKRELRKLARSRGIRTMRGHSLWPLLIELMQRDTEKHLAILRFIRTQLRRDARSAA